MIPVAILLWAAAQDKPQAWTPPTFSGNVSTTDSYRFKTDLDGVPGEVSVAHFKLSGDLTWNAGPRDIFRFMGGADHLKYDWSGGAALPFEDLYVLRLEGSYVRVFDAEWSGLAYASIYENFEESADLADAASIGLAAGAFWRRDQDLTLGLVLRYQSRIETSPYIFPLPYIDWGITPELSLKTEQKAGFGYLLAYSLDEAKEFGAETRFYWTGRRFRLDEGSVPDEGVFQDERFALDVGVRYQPKKGFLATLHAGLDVWQEFEVADRRGHGRVQFESDPSPFVIGSLGWSF